MQCCLRIAPSSLPESESKYDHFQPSLATRRREALDLNPLLEGVTAIDK
jgi:hypothetical protein